MEVEEQIEIAVPAEIIDQIWSEVDRWHVWDPDTKKASLNGPFAVGTTGRLVPQKGLGVSMIITERTVGRSFSAAGKIPFFCMHFEHTLLTVGSGVLVKHRVWFSGALAFLFGPSVAKMVRSGLPKTMQSLKKYAESRYEDFRATNAGQSTQRGNIL